MIRLVDIYVGWPDKGWTCVEGGSQLLYDLLKERPAEANISHLELPSWNHHRDFVNRHPYRYWYLLEVDGLFVGALNATNLNEIGIAILKIHQRRGYAIKAIRQFIATYQPLQAEPAQRAGHWIANVAPENEASHALFRKLGKPIQVTYRLD